MKIKKPINILIILAISLSAAFGCDDETLEKEGEGKNLDAGEADSGIDSMTDSGADTEDSSVKDASQNTDASGAYQWHTFFVGESGQSIALDSEENVFIAGYSYGINNESWSGPDGQEPLNGFQGDPWGYFILKLSNNGEYIWHTFYGSNSTLVMSADISVDNIGNIYLKGDSNDSWLGPQGEQPLHQFTEGFEESNFFILKLSSSGQYQWHSFWGTGEGDIAWGIAVDDIRNVYITGSSNYEWSGPEGQNPLNTFTEGVTNSFLLKMDTNGSYMWHTFYSYSAGRSIAINDFGELLISGRSRDGWNGPDGQMPLNKFHNGTQGMSDVFIMKLSEEGDYEWHTFYGSQGDDYGLMTDIDGNGNVYTRISSDAAWTGPNGENAINKTDGDIVQINCVLKLTDEGIYTWHTCYEYMNGGTLEVNYHGDSYLTGMSYHTWPGPDGQDPLQDHEGSERFSDILVVKIDKNGTYNWHTFYGSDQDDYGLAITLDSLDGLYITGESNESWTGPGGQSPLNEYSGDSDITILKLSQ